MAERTIPILPCPRIDDVLAFYEARDGLTPLTLTSGPVVGPRTGASRGTGTVRGRYVTP